MLDMFPSTTATLKTAVDQVGRTVWQMTYFLSYRAMWRLCASWANENARAMSQSRSLLQTLAYCRDTAESVKGFLRKPDTHVDLTLDMEDYYRIKDQEKQSNK